MERKTIKIPGSITDKRYRLEFDTKIAPFRILNNTKIKNKYDLCTISLYSEITQDNWLYYGASFKYYEKGKKSQTIKNLVYKTNSKEYIHSPYICGELLSFKKAIEYAHLELKKARCTIIYRKCIYLDRDYSSTIRLDGGATDDLFESSVKFDILQQHIAYLKDVGGQKAFDWKFVSDLSRGYTSIVNAIHKKIKNDNKIIQEFKSYKGRTVYNVFKIYSINSGDLFNGIDIHNDIYYSFAMYSETRVKTTGMESGNGYYIRDSNKIKTVVNKKINYFENRNISDSLLLPIYKAIRHFYDPKRFDCLSIYTKDYNVYSLLNNVTKHDSVILDKINRILDYYVKEFNIKIECQFISSDNCNNLNKNIFKNLHNKLEEYMKKEILL